MSRTTSVLFLLSMVAACGDSYTDGPPGPQGPNGPPGNERYHVGELGPDFQFPLPAAATDQLRAIEGLVPDIVVRWLDPLTWSTAIDQPRFGSHADFIGYWGVIDGALATTGSWDATSLSTYIRHWKRQVGGSWIHVIQDPATGDWQLDRSAPAVRYDATDATRLMITGQSVALDHDDSGHPLPPGVVVGIQNDCAGTVTPWGTVITAEENVDAYYGDLEPVWSSDQKLTAGPTNSPTFLAGNTIEFPFAASPTADFGYNPDANAVHSRDINGYLTEIDPGQPAGEYYGKTTAGVGHQKLGAVGRARSTTS